jgi:hypothetical protein
MQSSLGAAVIALIERFARPQKVGTQWYTLRGKDPSRHDTYQRFIVIDAVNSVSLRLRHILNFC